HHHALDFHDSFACTSIVHRYLRTVAMSEASTGTRPQTSHVTICDKSLQKTPELQPVAMSGSPPVATLNLETKTKSNSSSHEVTETGSTIVSDNSSPDSSDSSSGDESDTFSSNGSNSSSPNSSSPGNLHTAFPDSNVLKTIDLFDDCSEEKPNPRPISAWETSSQPDSDAETVILWNPAVNNGPGTVSVDSPAPEELGPSSNSCIQGNTNVDSGKMLDSASDDCSEETQSSQPSFSWETSSQSNSDAETVILWNPAPDNGPVTVFVDNSASEEPGIISGDCIQGDPDVDNGNTSDSASDDGSDSSSQNCPATFSPVGPRSLSPASSTSSQGALDIDDLEPRIPRGSQSVCAYASPVQGGCRTRTSCDRNDDTGRWRVEPDGFINEARRAGGPYLFPLPAVKLRLKLDDPLSEILEDYTLVRPIISILTEHGISIRSMKLRKCEYDFFNEGDYLPTLILSATRDTFDDSWVRASRQIWRHLSNVGLGQINVEISDLEILPYFFSPMRKTDRVWPVYMEILQRIQAEFDVTDMIGLRVIRMGTTDSGEKLPLTVNMDVRYDSNRDWRNTRDDIVKLLDDMDLPMVGVIITKGKNWRGIR
ncbi:unnamed protein product, partial [Penicillium glandicola]